MPPEGQALLRRAAGEAGVELLEADDLAGMIARKTQLLQRHRARLLISIGGSQANLGDAEAILKLAPGLVSPASAGKAGNGVIGAALRADIPVLHLLYIRGLARQAGIPYDAPPRRAAPLRVNPWWAVAGLALFFGVLWRHRRWRLEPAE
jgi:poly-gamma-glutamate system protein